MYKIKKVYIDSRYKTSYSISNSDFKFDITEALGRLENTVCYIDVSIPHSWYTIENHNNKLYIDNTREDLSLSASVLSIPPGNYNASNLASTLQSVLQAAYPNENYTCVYNTARGSITISAIRGFRIYTDVQVVEMTNSIGVQFPGWVNHGNQLITVDVNSLMSMKEIFRHSEPISPEITCEIDFIDLFNVHNIYFHCHNLGHYSTVGVRGESTIICKTYMYQVILGI